jgi:transposase-like protein DUF772
MATSPDPHGHPEERPLNLAKFVQPEPGQSAPAAPVDEGPTLRMRRIAAEIVEKKAVPAESTDEFGLPLKGMLGVITHCYARGVFCSKDIAQVLRDEPQMRDAFGRNLPNEDTIRRFRRRYAAEIEEALETLYRAYPGGGPAPATPETSEATQQLRREAAERLHDAVWTDNSKGRLG